VASLIQISRPDPLIALIGFYSELIGTPERDKKHVIAPGGHFVPRDVLIRETLDWLDTELGLPRS